MATNNYTKYDEDFKKSLVSLHQNGQNPGSALQRIRCFPIRPREMGETVFHR